MLDFSGQVVVVTGATGNVGSAVASTLAPLGATLVLTGTRQEELDALGARIAGGNPYLCVAGADPCKREGAQRVAAEAVSAFGHIDALVHTVGTFRMARVDEGAAADWSALMELNALATLLACEAVLPAMRARRYGRIVAVSAGAGLRAFAGGAVYAASKAAVLRLVEAVSDENRVHGVTANCIVPGTIDTPQNRAALPAADATRWVSAHEVAAAAAFLASRSASGVTGAALCVGGGP